MQLLRCALYLLLAAATTFACGRPLPAADQPGYFDRLVAGAKDLIPGTRKAAPKARPQQPRRDGVERATWNELDRTQASGKRGAQATAQQRASGSSSPRAASKPAAAGQPGARNAATADRAAARAEPKPPRTLSQYMSQERP